MGDFLQWDLFLDIETTGLNSNNEIVLISMQNGIDAKHEMLLSWESNEKEILKEFIKRITNFPSIGNKKLQIIGYNTLKFDIPLIICRCIFHDILQYNELYKLFYRDCWQIDLLQVFMSRNNFYYQKWNNILIAYGFPATKGSGSDIPGWFNNKEYDKILSYVESEFKYMPYIFSRIKSGDFRI